MATEAAGAGGWGMRGPVQGRGLIWADGGTGWSRAGKAFQVSSGECPWCNDGSFSTTELVETFTLDSGGYDEGGNPTYDDNGNLTFDGTQVYTYDAWNRLVGVAHGYTDGSDDVQSGYQFDTMSYDGLGRLITETIRNEGSGHDGTVDNYYDGSQLIEQQSGAPVDGVVPTIKQNVWGLAYVNELVQTAVNSDPGADNTCDTTYTVLQDANWNVERIVDKPAQGPTCEFLQGRSFFLGVLYVSSLRWSWPTYSATLISMEYFASDRTGATISLTWRAGIWGSQHLGQSVVLKKDR